MSGIGLLNEKPLHASLKEWYAQPGDRFEQPVDGYVVDVVREGLLLEIQTGNFASIKTKMKALAASHKVRVIYPIACEKWIVKQPRIGIGKASRRKSPKRGRVEDLFWEMVSVPWLPTYANFSLEVVLVREEEVRRYVGGRKNGATEAGGLKSVACSKSSTDGCSRSPPTGEACCPSRSIPHSPHKISRRSWASNGNSLRR